MKSNEKLIKLTIENIEYDELRDLMIGEVNPATLVFNRCMRDKYFGNNKKKYNTKKNKYHRLKYATIKTVNVVNRFVRETDYTQQIFKLYQILIDENIGDKNKEMIQIFDSIGQRDPRMDVGFSQAAEEITLINRKQEIFDNLLAINDINQGLNPLEFMEMLNEGDPFKEDNDVPFLDS